MKGTIAAGSAYAATYLTWIITIIAGVCLVGIQLVLAYPGSTGTGSFLGFIFVLSLLFSIPGMIVYHIIMSALFKSGIGLSVTKVFLSLLAILIITTTILLAFHSLDLNFDLNTNLMFIIAYCVPFIVCIFIFNRKHNK